MDRGDLASARKRYEEALALRSQAGEKQSAAESRMSLAKLAVEEGHPSDAEASVRGCKEQFHTDKQADDELSASIALIDALVAQGKQGEAQKEMGAAQQLGKQSQNHFLRLQFELISSRVLLKSEHPDEAASLLREVNRDARRYGFAGLEFESELALAELATKIKHGVEAKRKFLALQTSARPAHAGLAAPGWRRIPDFPTGDRCA